MVMVMAVPSDAKTAWKAYCDRCKWSFGGLATEHEAIRMMTMHNKGSCPTASAKVGTVRTIVSGQNPSQKGSDEQ